MAPPNSSASSNVSADEAAPSPRYDEAVDRFVEFWGEMASTWGINRIMARVYALLYSAARPLNTDEIMERLQISRGSANMNLRSLVDWDIVEKTTVSGSRKDHYVAETDVWQVTARIIEERERREVRPVKEQLRTVAQSLVPDDETIEERPAADRQLHHRLQKLIDLMEMFEGVSEALLPLVKNRNEALIRQLIAAARTLDPGAAASDESGAPDE